MFRVIGSFSSSQHEIGWTMESPFMEAIPFFVDVAEIIIRPFIKKVTQGQNF